MIRPRGGTTRRRDDQQEQAIATIVEIGRRLRTAREERGLSMLAVHDRLSRPITQLDALESGDLASLPDQALAISTLRRYATFLGLDGDSLALKMIDAWSASPYASLQAGAPVANVVAAVTTGPDHLRAFTQTGKVPKVGGRSTSPTGTGPNAHEVTTGPPTGTFPVVPRRELRHSRRAVARARRQLRAPRSLKFVTWLACILVLAALVGLGIRQWHPQWLASSHILRVVEPGSQNPHPAVTPLAPPTQPASATQAPKTTAPATHHHQTSAVELALAGPTGEAYSVNTSHFTVNVATSGPCWVQITNSQSSIPLVSSVQPAGKSLSETAKGTMTVELGSSSVLVGISIKGKTVFLATPHVVPFTYTFVPPS
ncbi:MAG: helix-turn-helix transcriptional regulator [Acidimicrobiales bacterium]